MHKTRRKGSNSYLPLRRRPSCKKALKSGYKAGIYSDYAKDVIRPSAKECAQNGRARSTKCGGRLRSNRKNDKERKYYDICNSFRIDCDSSVFSREPNIEPHWCSDAFDFIVLGMFSARMVSFGFRLKTLNWQNKSAPLP